MLWRTFFSTLRRTSSRLVTVRPAVISSIAIRNRVRSRKRGTKTPAELPAMEFCMGSKPAHKQSADELISHSMHCAEVYGTGGILLQLLPKLQDVIIHCSGGRIILVTPDFIQQFVPADDPVCVLDEKLESLKFLSGEHHDFAVALDLHFPEIG